MTNTNETFSGRDPETGQFLVGHSGNGGRPKGSRNKLGQQFIDDLFVEWQRSGAEALKRVAKDDPTAFVRVVAQILPKEIDTTLTTVDIDIDLFAEAKTFAEAFRLSQRFIGGDLEVIEAAELENDDG